MDGSELQNSFWIPHPARLNSIAHRRADCPVLAGASLPVRFAEKDCGDPALACAIRKSRVGGPPGVFDTVRYWPRPLQIDCPLFRYATRPPHREGNIRDSSSDVLMRNSRAALHFCFLLVCERGPPISRADSGRRFGRRCRARLRASESPGRKSGAAGLADAAVGESEQPRKGASARI